MPVFRWTTAKEKAAQLLAEDDLSDHQIAENCGVSRQSLAMWKRAPEFQAKLEEIASEIRKEIRKRGIAIIENRVRALQDRWGRMKRVIEERAAAPEMQVVPGGKTGLLVHNVKAIGSGETAERIDLYEVDTGLLKELRDHEKQASQELGQWTEQHSHSGEITYKEIRGVSADDL